MTHGRQESTVNDIMLKINGEGDGRREQRMETRETQKGREDQTRGWVQVVEREVFQSHVNKALR